MEQFPVIIFNDDLIFNTKIKNTLAEKGHDCKVARSQEKFSVILSESSGAYYLIVNLNAGSPDKFEVIKKALQDSKCRRLVTFFSHVDTELAEEAAGLGVSDIYPRSEFVRVLPDLF